MCLSRKEFKNFKVAKKNIVVYKVAIKTFPIFNEEKNVKQIEEKYSSYYRDANIEINTVLTEDFNKMKPHYNRFWNEYKFDIGFHSFYYKNSPIRKYKAGLKTKDRIVLFKCIIPKGSYYIDGVFDGHKSLISEKIIYKKVLNIKSFFWGF